MLHGVLQKSILKTESGDTTHIELASYLLLFYLNKRLKKSRSELESSGNFTIRMIPIFSFVPIPLELVAAPTVLISTTPTPSNAVKTNRMQANSIH